MTVSRELSRYNLGLVGVQEVRWKCGGTETAENKHFSMERRMKIMNRYRFFCA
jgi:hypothetical protein